MRMSRDIHMNDTRICMSLIHVRKIFHIIFFPLEFHVKREFYVKNINGKHIETITTKLFFNTKVW